MITRGYATSYRKPLPSGAYRQFWRTRPSSSSSEVSSVRPRPAADLQVCLAVQGYATRLVPPGVGSEQADTFEPSQEAYASSKRLPTRQSARLCAFKPDSHPSRLGSIRLM